MSSSVSEPSIPPKIAGTIKKSQEKTRTWIAQAIVYIFSIVTVIMFIPAVNSDHRIDFIYSSLVGIVGVIVGFYFGKK